MYLLDTRDASGNVLGLGSGGMAKAVNGYGALATDASGSPGRISLLSTSSAPRSLPAGGSAVVADRSAVPDGTPSPEIKSVRVDGGRVYIKVSGTVPYLQYNASRGADPGRIGSEDGDVNIAAPVQGAQNAAGEIELSAPVSGNSGFFRVNRN